MTMTVGLSGVLIAPSVSSGAIGGNRQRAHPVCVASCGPRPGPAVATAGVDGHGGWVITGDPTSTRIRVRSIPAGHDYVRHAIGPTTDRSTAVIVLADPVLDPAEPSRWWPHPALEAAERPEVLDGAGVVHVHFGYEHRTPAQIAEFVGAVQSRGLPLLVTVHDLTNPHEPDSASHLERTGHLVRGADTVITLTPGAATEIRRRWGVDPRVIPHPRLMPAEITEPHRLRRVARDRSREPRTVGVVLGSLRAGIAVEELLPQLAAALPTDTRLVVMVRSDALAAARDPDHPRHAAATELDRLAAEHAGRHAAEHASGVWPAIDVREHEHLSDSELCDALANFDALILPHRHGTHSGWLELCRDLGLPPVIPRIGHLSEQWGDAEVGTYDLVRPASNELRSAVLRSLEGPPPEPRGPQADDPAVSAAHAELYRAAAVRAAAAAR